MLCIRDGFKSLTHDEFNSIIFPIGISNLLKITEGELRFELREFGFGATFFSTMLWNLYKQIVTSPKLELQWSKRNRNLGVWFKLNLVTCLGINPISQTSRKSGCLQWTGECDGEASLRRLT